MWHALGGIPYAVVYFSCIDFRVWSLMSRMANLFEGFKDFRYAIERSPRHLNSFRFIIGCSNMCQPILRTLHLMFMLENGFVFYSEVTLNVCLALVLLCWRSLSFGWFCRWQTVLDYSQSISATLGPTSGPPGSATDFSGMPAKVSNVLAYMPFRIPLHFLCLEYLVQLR